MTRSRDTSNIFDVNSDIVNSSELNIAINTASAAAVASANTYTDNATPDLTPAIQAASAAAVLYTDSQINSLTTGYISETINTGNETYTVTNSGMNYVISAQNNPTLTLIKGNTYTFVINAPGHPFWIQTSSAGYNAGNVYSTGTTNLGTASGTITWTIPENAPDTLFYQCQYHSMMWGRINLITTNNLYFTNQRAIDAASATYILQSNQQNIINSASGAAVTYLIDSAPATLDTLNELSAALNDDPNFYTTIQSVYLSQSSASTTYLSQASASTTYLSQASASSTYLTQSSASTQYEKNIPYSSSTPSSPVTGDMWVDSSLTPPSLKVYTGSEWVQLGAAVDDSQAIIASRMFA